MKKILFEFHDYRAYLRDWIASQPRKGRGIQGKLAQALGCQATFISQVLRGDVDFNQDHAYGVSEFIGHDAAEARYFLHLVLLARAGSPGQRKFLGAELERMAREQSDLKKQLRARETLSDEEMQIYYSSWQYGAVRVALTIPALREPQPIAERLGIPVARVQEILNFLCATGLAERRPQGVFPTQLLTHLGKDSPLINQHHTNWRLKLLEGLDRRAPDDVHFSSVVSIGGRDVARIRNLLNKAVTDFSGLVKDSPEQELYSMGIDFFRL